MAEQDAEVAFGEYYTALRIVTNALDEYVRDPELEGGKSLLNLSLMFGANVVKRGGVRERTLASVVKALAPLLRRDFPKLFPDDKNIPKTKP